MRSYKNFLENEDGATAIEYAFLCLLIAVPLVPVFTNVGTTLIGAFQKVVNGFAK